MRNNSKVPVGTIIYFSNNCANAYRNSCGIVVGAYDSFFRIKFFTYLKYRKEYFDNWCFYNWVKHEDYKVFFKRGEK